MTWREASLAASLAVLCGCAGEDAMAGRGAAVSARDGGVDASATEDRALRDEDDERTPRDEGEPAPRDEGERGEGEFGGAFGPEVHMLVTDIAAHLICDRIDGGFMPLRSEEGQPASGHLWVRDCVARREGNRLTVELGTRAWRWVERDTRRFGATFALDQYVTVDARITLEGVLDVAYNRERRIARAWLSPSRAPEVSATVIGDLDVDAKGLWSTIVGGIASILGASPSEQAGEQAEEQTRGELDERLREGIFVAMDLCTRAEDVGLGKPEEGALPEPQVPVPSATYVAAQLVELHPGGLAAVGPFRTVRGGVEVQVRARDGGTVHTELVCEDEGTRILRSYFDGGLEALPQREPLDEATLEPGREATLEAGDDCTTILLARASRSSERATLEIVAESRRERDALVDGCNDTPSGSDAVERT